MLRSFPRRRCISSIAALLFVLIAPAHAESWSDVDLALTGYDNLTRAASAEDKRGDVAVALAITGGHYFALSGSDGVSLTIDARGEAYRRYTGLDVAAIGAGASYRRKLGVGRNVPWVLASVHVARESYRDALRDSDRLAVTTELGRRFTDALELSAGSTLERRLGRHDPEAEVPGYSARVFDLHGLRGFLRGSYALGEALLLGGEVGVRRGFVESTAQQSLAIFTASDALADDPAFRDERLYAYRLRATTYFGALNASWAMSDKMSLNFSYADHRSRAANRLSYDDRAITLSLLYRYP